MISDRAQLKKLDRLVKSGQIFKLNLTILDQKLRVNFPLPQTPLHHLPGGHP